MSDGFSKVFDKKTLQCANSSLPLASVHGKSKVGSIRQMLNGLVR